jgi:hypothetical protein
MNIITVPFSPLMAVRLSVWSVTEFIKLKSGAFVPKGSILLGVNAISLQFLKFKVKSICPILCYLLGYF